MWYAACLTRRRYHAVNLWIPSVMSDTNAPEEEAAPAKGKKMMLAILLVGGVAIGGGAGAFFAGPLLAEKVMGPVAPAAPGAEGEHGEAAAEEGHGEEGEEGEHGEGATAAVYQIENLVLNPAQSGGTRFLMLTVAFQVKDETVIEQMKLRDAEVRDAILTVIGSKTVEQLVEITGRDPLKAELKGSVAPLFAKDAVTQIYFPQFVVQ